MANARRVIFGTYVIPTQSLEMEETTIRQVEFQTSPNGTLGGKGIATINATQWGDQWTSTTHSDIDRWEEFTTVNWEDVLLYPTKSGRLALSDTTKQLTTDSTDCAFLYIKNLGDTNEVLVSLNGTGGNYYIIIPPGGSVHLRGTDALECNEVFAKCSSGETTEIEYLIAKE
tara:strand:- start:40 stop:555 length:516 start_codon:yes stop_codon:yes gene_type:complete